jgi:hypothetical protein
LLVLGASAQVELILLLLALLQLVVGKEMVLRVALALAQVTADQPVQVRLGKVIPGVHLVVLVVFLLAVAAVKALLVATPQVVLMVEMAARALLLQSQVRP